MNDSNIFTLSFPEAKDIVVSGDIHGNFNQLVVKLCIQYQMRNTVLIVAGDCGFGFEKQKSYENMVKRNTKRMNEANNWIVFIRGNHDNPAYFDGYTFRHKRFIAVPDYTILQACSHTVLCVGGGISIDRQYRLQVWEKRQVRSVSDSQADKLTRNVYWGTEAPIFDKEKMIAINAKYAVDTVITHTAPSFCELLTKNNLNAWTAIDNNLLSDITSERATMDKLHDRLKTDHHPMSHWFYGHFHQSWHCDINGTLFRMLDIMEFCQIYQL